MAWVKKTVEDSAGRVLFLKETYTLPDYAAAATYYGYSSIITDFGPNMRNQNRYISIGLNPSAVTGTNLDIDLYGSWTRDGDKALLKSNIVTALDATGWVIGQVDLNAYPFPYYWVRWLADQDESANTIQVIVAGH